MREVCIGARADLLDRPALLVLNLFDCQGKWSCLGDVGFTGSFSNAVILYLLNCYGVRSCPVIVAWQEDLTVTFEESLQSTFELSSTRCNGESGCIVMTTCGQSADVASVCDPDLEVYLYV